MNSMCQGALHRERIMVQDRILDYFQQLHKTYKIAQNNADYVQTGAEKCVVN